METTSTEMNVKRRMYFFMGPLLTVSLYPIREWRRCLLGGLTPLILALFRHFQLSLCLPVRGAPSLTTRDLATLGVVTAPYRGRIAPSPTGLLHAGHARTFWVAYERCRDAAGTLIFRNEDLDPQ